MPPVKTAVPPQAAPVYDAYRGWLAARGVGNKTFDSGARCFLARFPDPQAWAGAAAGRPAGGHPPAAAAAAELPDAARPPAARL